MRNLILIDTKPCMTMTMIDGKYNTTVSNYDELYDYITSNILSDNDTDIDEWIEDVKDYFGAENEDELKQSLIEGEFDSDMFIVHLYEEWQVVCMTEEKYNTVKDFDRNQLVDYVNDWIESLYIKQ